MAKKHKSAALKQGVGVRDTAHGLLDLPVHPWDPDERKRKRVRYAEGGSVNRFTGFYEEKGKRYETYRDAAGREWKDNGKDAPSLTPDSAAIEKLRQQRDDQRRDKAERSAPTTRTKMGDTFKNGGEVCGRGDGCAVRGKTRGRMV